MASESRLTDNTFEPVDETGTQPFLVTIYFRNGLRQEFIVDKFDWSARPGFGRTATWNQECAVPGDDLLQWLDLNEVILVTTASIEPERRR